MQYGIIIRRPKLWNELLQNEKEGNSILFTFSKKLKRKIN